MTQKEHTDAVLAAYRQGYRDGVEDRPAAGPTQGIPMSDIPNPESMEIMNQILGNFMDYSGKPQETPESLVRRTRA